MKVLQIAICEDLDEDAAYLRSLIESSGIAACISLFKNGGAFLAARPAGRFDLVFFDIYMAGISGVEAARVLREGDERCGVVFTTSSVEHMLEAFDVGAEQYLIKPIAKEKLVKVLKKRLAIAESARKTCPVKTKERRVDVPLDDIYYVEAYQHNCFVHTANGIIETSSNIQIGDFEPFLSPPQFLRCHQSYIVNMNYVENIGRDFVMKNGHTVYIRRGDLAKCAKELDKWRLYKAAGDEI